ncbi:synaptotagmin-5-like [Nematostella vectensis]|uniref:synaptotagmin-5-like n=1 Tax=Nematostella vectensis TaxID=45351 RepID=UPI0020776170|nr:synaptotagmin-5-like [Nematostella vectensis]
MIKNSLDPLLESCLPPFIASIEVNDFTLGTHTPFIKYVEAYDNFDDLRKLRATALSMRSPPDDLLTRPKYKAVLDLDIGLASPEARFVIRIRLGNKGILGTETDIAIEDFQISGRMQLVFSFNRNIAFPHLASISFCFLEEPQVSFNIRMLKAVQLMDFPLVRQWVTQLVNDTLKLSLVDPDRIYIPLCEDPDDAGRGADCACGALTLKITGGVQGRPTDDTYWCVVSLGDQKYSTKEISSEGPWSDHVTILVYNLHYDKVIVKVKGKRKLGTKYTVFQDTTALARLYLDSNPIQEKCFEKEGLRGSSMKMEMEYTPLPVVTIPSEEDSEQFEELAVSTSQRLRTDPDEVSGVLLVCMHGGESMIPMDKNGLSDPYCVVYANRNLMKKTEVAKETLDPVWNAMVEFPVANFTQVTLSFAVFDKDDAIDDFLGSCNFKLTKV